MDGMSHEKIAMIQPKILEPRNEWLYTFFLSFRPNK